MRSGPGLIWIFVKSCSRGGVGRSFECVEQTASGTGASLASVCTALFSTPDDQDDSPDGDHEYRWKKGFSVASEPLQGGASERINGKETKGNEEGTSSTSF